MKNILQSAFSKRSPLFDVTDAYRIVNGVADGFPGLTLDRYGDRYQIQFFGPELLANKNEVVEAVGKLFNPVCVVVKERLSSSGRSLENAPMDVVIGSREDAIGVVREGRAMFHVDLMDTVNPGLFLDMRHVRLDVENRFREMSGAVPASDKPAPSSADTNGLRFLTCSAILAVFLYTLGWAVLLWQLTPTSAEKFSTRVVKIMHSMVSICVRVNFFAVTLSSMCAGRKRKDSASTASFSTRQALPASMALTLTFVST